MSIKKWIKNLDSNTLYYPGCLTKFVGKDILNNYIKILNDMKIDFIMLKDLEVCCGSPIINSGHKDEAKDLALKNYNLFKDHSVNKIITNCPACYHMFSKVYPEVLEKWDIEVEHITQKISNAIKSKKLNLENKNLNFTYHDPCHLGRYSDIYEPPREILRSIGNLKEMKFNKNYSFCCGGGSGVKSNYPDLANSIAKQRIEMVKEIDVNCVVTSCPMCYYNLKDNSKGIKVKEISQMVVGDEK